MITQLSLCKWNTFIVLHPLPQRTVVIFPSLRFYRNFMGCLRHTQRLNAAIRRTRWSLSSLRYPPGIRSGRSGVPNSVDRFQTLDGPFVMTSNHMSTERSLARHHSINEGCNLYCKAEST